MTSELVVDGRIWMRCEGLYCLCAEYPRRYLRIYAPAANAGAWGGRWEHHGKLPPHPCDQSDRKGMIGKNAGEDAVTRRVV